MAQKISKDKAREEASQKKQEAYEMIKNMAEGFKKDPSAIADMLVFADRFAYSYSPKNMQLIYAQNDAAMFCASFDEWRQKGCSVKKGEQGMKIFVPVKAKFLELPDGSMVQLKYATKEQKEAYKAGKLDAKTKVYFKIGHTFDVHQTTFPPEDYPKLAHRGYSSEEHAKCLEAMIAWADKELNCPTFYKEHENEIHGAALYGFFHVRRNEIHLSSSLMDTAALSTFCHELGHALLHNRLERFSESSASQKEFEADCMRVLLNSHMGFDIPDTAKSHLADHYKVYLKECEGKEDVKPEDSFSRVYDVFRKHVPVIDEYLERFVPGHMPDLDKDKGMTVEPEGGVRHSPIHRNIR